MPSNEYFDSSGAPSTGSAGSSSIMRSEFDSIEEGFDKLPTLSGKAGQLTGVNSGASALESKTNAAVRTQLDVYSTSETYSQTEVDANTYTRAWIDANIYTQTETDAAIAAATITWESVDSDDTIAAGEGFKVNTLTGAAILTVTCPLNPSDDDIFYILDVAGTFSRYNCKLARNGEKIFGLAEDCYLDINKMALAFIFSGSTYGWVAI